MNLPASIQPSVFLNLAHAKGRMGKASLCARKLMVAELDKVLESMAQLARDALREPDAPDEKYVGRIRNMAASNAAHKLYREKVVSHTGTSAWLEDGGVYVRIQFIPMDPPSHDWEVLKIKLA